MKLSCGLHPSASVVENAKVAESLGYERVYCFDSPALYGDVFIALARVAEATDRIGLGTAVLIPSLRHVMATAASIASIEELAPGRLIVAIGTGFTGRRMFGQPALPWKQVEKYISDLKGLLRGFEVEVDGQITKMFHPPGLAPPRPIRTKILVAANGPKGLAVADRVGDGVMCAAALPEGAKDAVLINFGTVLDEGERLTDPRVQEAAGAAVAVVYHAAYEGGGAAVDNLPGGADWRAEIEAIPESVRHLYIHENHCVALSDRDRRHIDMNLAPGMSFTGTADQLRARIGGLAERGTAEFVYCPLGSDIPRELERMAAVFRD